MKVIITCLLLAFAINQIAMAQVPPENWQLLGKTQAKFNTDHDAILLHKPYNNFNSIKFKVTNAPLKLVKLVVTYDSGAPDNIETLHEIPKGEESGVIDLRGVGTRKITRIDFWYDTKGPAQGHADVAAFGMK
jgi:hypothetical protein